MQEKMIVSNAVVIHADAKKVWDVLVNPDQTEKYMFGCRTVSDWMIGSSLEWRGIYEGKEMVFVKGTILDIAPPFRLIYTVIDPTAAMADIPENYLRVTYRLDPAPDLTTLFVSQEGFEQAANGEKRYQEAYNQGEGWNPILVQIKKIAEQ